jgi:hypothetical protein
LGCFAAAALLLRTAAAQDAFEVAFVKPADPISNPVVGFRAYPGGRVVVTNNTPCLKADYLLYSAPEGSERKHLSE